MKASRADVLEEPILLCTIGTDSLEMVAVIGLSSGPWWTTSPKPLKSIL
jgi:hypothetical protein